MEAPRASRRRWAVLAAGMVAMTAGCASQYGLPFLVPALLADGLSLAQAGLLVACPTAGLLLTLVAWGAAADRWGERVVLSSGLGLAGVALLAGTTADSLVTLGLCFLLAGAAGASVHAASGRLILGWFAASERGLAMGFRQTAQPLGVAVAGLTLPPLMHVGRWAALAFLAVFCLAATALVLLVVRDPERPPVCPGERAASPYRTAVLWRIHAASALLTIPQFTVAAFGPVFLVDQLGWSASASGRLIAFAQVGGAAARLGVGYWSDRVGSRMRPMRQLAIAIALVMAGLAAGAATDMTAIAVVVVVAAIVSVTTNGLAFTAVAEYAGGSWAGRALGIQNTAQNLTAAATPPVLAALIAATTYAPAFALAVAFPAVAAVLVPGRDAISRD